MKNCSLSSSYENLFWEAVEELRIFIYPLVLGSNYCKIENNRYYQWEEYGHEYSGEPGQGQPIGSALAP
ncbi:MAG: hypothetical protein AOA65_1766 [Candidatus Bathyarchaeota archaeon BA1]|nr:MAG: hypothetical protein AOA65_1766 [Candidatus Bathyarchaeota archaeon BA1]